MMFLLQPANSRHDISWGQLHHTHIKGQTIILCQGELALRVHLHRSAQTPATNSTVRQIKLSALQGFYVVMKLQNNFMLNIPSTCTWSTHSLSVFSIHNASAQSDSQQRVCATFESSANVWCRCTANTTAKCQLKRWPRGSELATYINDNL